MNLFEQLNAYQNEKSMSGSSVLLRKFAALAKKQAEYIEYLTTEIAAQDVYGQTDPKIEKQFRAEIKVLEGK